MNRIKELRLSLGLTQQDIADRVDSTPQQISRLERSERILREGWREKIAPVLHCRPDDLLVTAPGRPGYPPIVYAKIIGMADMGRLGEILKVPASEWRRGWLPVPHHRESVVALTIEDQSVNRIAASGSYAVFDFENQELEDGRYYVLQAGQEFVIRIYRDVDGPPRYEPDSLSSEFRTLYVGEGPPLIVVGRVFGFQRPV